MSGHGGVEGAVDRALEHFVDRVQDGEQVRAAYQWLAEHALRLAGQAEIETLSATHAQLRDGTVLRYEPNMGPVPRMLVLGHMVGSDLRLRHLPPPCTADGEPSVRTTAGTSLWTYPIGGRPLLRGWNHGAPVLVRADGTRLWSPDDAVTFHEGVLLRGPALTVTVDRDLRVRVTPTPPAPEPSEPAAEEPAPMGPIQPAVPVAA